MAPSLIGGWIKANSPVIDWQVIGTGPNPFQSMPILTNPVPIPGQSMSTHATPCANRRSIFHKRKVCQLSNLSQSQQIQCQSWPIQCQSQAITEDIPALNQGTSPLCGLASSPLGGRFQDNRAFLILTNPFECWPIHANPGQSGANPWPIRDQLRS